MNGKNFSQIDSDKMIEILKRELYFAVIKKLDFKSYMVTDDAIYFTVDSEFEYRNFYYDFGPYNISDLCKYCARLNTHLANAKGQKRVVYCAGIKPEKKANAAFLIGCYCVLFLGMTIRHVMKLLKKIGPYKEFRDASHVVFPYTIPLEIFITAVSKASKLNFFNFEDFDVVEYDMYQKFQHGDMNWLVPRKFLAFSGPGNDSPHGHPPKFYLKYFNKNDIRTVIRLNMKTYDAAVFDNAGIKHYDLIYPDGSVPPKEILSKFFSIVETAPSAVAVHCKAGLGRTGSLIGAYIIKHYRLTSREAIAWMRVCRPGSVIGMQQLWLEKLEPSLKKWGNDYRSKIYGDKEKVPYHKYGIYSKLWPIERKKARKENKMNMLYQKRNNTQWNENKTFKIDSHSCIDDISNFLSNFYGIGQKSKGKPSKEMKRKRVNTIKVCTPPSPNRDDLLLVDRETDTNDYVLSYMEQEARKKWYNQFTTPAQGDKLLNIKMQKTAEGKTNTIA